MVGWTMHIFNLVKHFFIIFPFLRETYGNEVGKSLPRKAQREFNWIVLITSYIIIIIVVVVVVVVVVIVIVNIIICEI